MAGLTSNDLRAAFVTLSRALDPRGNKPPKRENYADSQRFMLDSEKYLAENEVKQGQAIEAAFHIAEEMAVLFQRFVVAQELMAKTMAEAHAIMKRKTSAPTSVQE